MRMPFGSHQAREEFNRLLEEEDIAPHAVLWSDVFEGVILSLLLFSPVATVLLGSPTFATSEPRRQEQGRL